ncbi:MAG: hypothetical protein D3923_03440 [Candidatus Electrothrix sp. AR3]|nr:hypothetical protein [Candidatus Electrothrix sp. AR3]
MGARNYIFQPLNLDQVPNMLLFNNVFRMIAVIFLLFTVMAFPCQGEESKQKPQRKELAWSQSDGLRHEIYYSSYKQGVWETPVMLTDNNANNLHPVLAVAPNGDRWIFWSAVRPDGISIEYVVQRNDTWSEPLKMELKHRWAITPSIAIDKNASLWLVWAGNDGGRDEIYYSHRTNSGWEDAKILNKIKNVPDIKPEIIINAQGEIKVQWLGFRDRSYKLLGATYTAAEGWSAEQEVPEQEQEELEKEEERGRACKRASSLSAQGKSVFFKGSRQGFR